MKKKIITLLSITSFCLCGCSVSYDVKEYDEVPIAKYVMPKLDKDTMPISAWAGPDSSLGLNTSEQFKNAKDAGLNMIYAGLGDIENTSPTKDIDVECEYSELLGYELVLYTYLKGQKIVMKASPKATIKAGDKYKLLFNQDSLYFFDLDAENRIK